MSKAGCGIIVKIPDGKFLICKRSSEEKLGSGLWNFPGGSLEKDEEPFHAAVRELYEETAIICNKSDLIKFVEDIKQDYTEYGFVVYPDYNLDLPEIGISSEVSGYRFVSKEGIEQMIQTGELWEPSVELYNSYKFLTRSK